mmetsp:Transcript_31763/g.48716  ORF Transcript_31763/g.48716 Transcript_31763/m.48716 type:complete len:437 (-) Transcript_31763:94-1404(-)|eukprot:CAMPEP_0195282514 /NCGR_PEP_ID=MMETSP0707-20130614/1348_1 /TAXON_ID=33640 /ORGANISM="Asterionellopsis glacialis, Strain CCMP134" /LENGTH=436 /DNA_ID=CAMNT_0040341489 /DNA_START=31 /DNA_END=1341 /DNA_ORIENTATION=+
MTADDYGNRVSTTPFLTTDLEEDRRAQKKDNQQAENLLHTIGEVLHNADGMLGELEDNDMLGSALVRCCQELADGVHDMTTQLAQQTPNERRALAQAVRNDLQLFEEKQEQQYQQRPLLLHNNSDNNPDQEGTTTVSTKPLENNNNSPSAMAAMSDDDMLEALSGAETVLMDIEDALRSIDRQDADEIADVALTLARLFLASIQSIHATLTPEDITGTTQQQQQQHYNSSSDRVELLDDNGDQVVMEHDDETTTNRHNQPKNLDRVRCLWPPLGPSVSSACEWGKEEAAKRPILAIALGLTLWPAVIITATIGTPVVLMDGALQHAYGNFAEGPLGEQLERGAAEAYHAGKLSLVCGKLVLRQTSRVVSRQIRRRGGMGKIAQDFGGMAVDRALHPVETVGMAWNGVCWSVETVKHATMMVQEAVSRENDKASEFS